MTVEMADKSKVFPVKFRHEKAVGKKGAVWGAQKHRREDGRLATFHANKTEFHNPPMERGFSHFTPETKKYSKALPSAGKVFNSLQNQLTAVASITGTDCTVSVTKSRENKVLFDDVIHYLPPYQLPRVIFSFTICAVVKKFAKAQRRSRVCSIKGRVYLH